eukprot:2597600-Alexandrium_andersonii.AAC.1
MFCVLFLCAYGCVSVVVVVAVVVAVRPPPMTLLLGRRGRRSPRCGRTTADGAPVGASRSAVSALRN